MASGVPMGACCGLLMSRFWRADCTAKSGPTHLPSVVFTPLAPPRIAKTYRPGVQRRCWAPAGPTGCLRMASVHAVEPGAVTEFAGSSSQSLWTTAVPESTRRSANVEDVTVAGSICTGCGTYFVWAAS